MLRSVLLAIMFLLAQTTTVWAGSVTLAQARGDGPYNEFATVLREVLDGTPWKLTTAVGGDAINSALDEHPDIIVTTGSEALKQVLARGGGGNIIATLLPRQNYEKLLGEFAGGRFKSTAIYLDQPPSRQANFLRHLLPNKKKIGLLVSPETRSVAKTFRQALASTGMSLDLEDSDTDNALLPALNTLLPRVDALLAIPDSSIYRRDNIKAILITSYRHQRPIIAFSPAFVTAGALAAIYSTPAQIARQTGSQILTTGTTLAAPGGPSQFAISINFNVAEALGLDIADETTIRRAILADKEQK